MKALDNIGETAIQIKKEQLQKCMENLSSLWKEYTESPTPKNLRRLADGYFSARSNSLISFSSLNVHALNEIEDWELWNSLDYVYKELSAQTR